MEPVERGYHVSPVVRQFKRVEPRPSAVNLEARIVAAFSAARMLSAETFVVLSRGAKDGVEVGNRTFVVPPGRRLSPDHGGLGHHDPATRTRWWASCGWSMSGRTPPWPGSPAAPRRSASARPPKCGRVTSGRRRPPGLRDQAWPSPEWGIGDVFGRSESTWPEA